MVRARRGCPAVTCEARIGGAVGGFPHLGASAGLLPPESDRWVAPFGEASGEEGEEEGPGDQHETRNEGPTPSSLSRPSKHAILIKGIPPFHRASSPQLEARPKPPLTRWQQKQVPEDPPVHRASPHPRCAQRNCERQQHVVRNPSRSGLAAQTFAIRDASVARARRQTKTPSSSLSLPPRLSLFLSRPPTYLVSIPSLR